MERNGIRENIDKYRGINHDDRLRKTKKNLSKGFDSF